jgi:hypothetical protein
VGQHHLFGMHQALHCCALWWASPASAAPVALSRGTESEHCAFHFLAIRLLSLRDSNANPLQKMSRVIHYFPIVGRNVLPPIFSTISTMSTLTPLFYQALAVVIAEFGSLGVAKNTPEWPAFAAQTTFGEASLLTVACCSCAVPS